MGQNKARALRDQAELRTVLSTVLDLDPDAAGIDYRLVGTSAALLQGVELPTGDVDILVAWRDDVDTTAAALQKGMTERGVQPALQAWVLRSASPLEHRQTPGSRSTSRRPHHHPPH
ncbi:hypothetical protein ABZ793_33135 [Micromonospora sp. NPDC047465]|uniref:hypothetical protein n=1 Tax=Micromonospora sp. NPDC047465 TaxID=3154813 RepID=UPI0033ED3409